MTPNLGIIGFGYTAQFVAEHMAAQGWQVWGTSRNKATRDASHFTLVDFTQTDLVRCLHATTHLLISTPAPGQDPMLATHADLLSQHAAHLRWIGYFSTTGVYGNHDGAHVDETTVIVPATERIDARCRAEKAWLAYGARHGIPTHIFRLAGIYGPKRNALMQLRDGKITSVYKPGHMFSRIHVEDIAQIIHASICNPTTGHIYNACDDETAESHVVLEYAAQLLGLPAPKRVPYKQAILSEMARDFYRNNRMVSNQKMKQVLGIKLLYPTYREGLRALLAEK